MAHYTFLFLLVCYIIITLFLEMFKCHPPASQYSLIRIGQVENSVKCLHFTIIGISLSAVHVTFDFALLSVPLIILYKIKMDLGKKIRLAILFSVGSVSCIASVMRHYVQHRAVNRPDLTCEFRTGNSVSSTLGGTDNCHQGRSPNVHLGPWSTSSSLSLLLPYPF